MSQGARFGGQTVSSIPFGMDRNGRPLRIWRRRKDVTLRSCLVYPIVDGPGVALIIFLPPFLAIMGLPVFDLMVSIKPGNALNPVALLILPFAMPLIACFGLTVGYILIFLGRVLTSAAIGEVDHPRWPKWDRMEILEELARWTWAGLMGLTIGGFPAMMYWVRCGKVDWLDVFLFFDLLILGVSYAQMALVAALLHETMVAANPVTVIRSIARIGWDYLGPCLITAGAVGIGLAAWYLVLLKSPSIEVGVFGLWACWVYSLYAAMAVFRVLGTSYYKHSKDLDWFRTA